MSRIEHSSPAKIIGKVMNSDAVKSDHPFFETAVIGVHVLYTWQTLPTTRMPTARLIGR